MLKKSAYNYFFHKFQYIQIQFPPIIVTWAIPRKNHPINSFATPYPLWWQFTVANQYHVQLLFDPHILLVNWTQIKFFDWFLLLYVFMFIMLPTRDIVTILTVNIIIQKKWLSQIGNMLSRRNDPWVTVNQWESRQVTTDQSNAS